MIKLPKKIISKLNFLKFLFYIFPIIMMTSSGYLTVYFSIFVIFSLYYFFSNKIKINIKFLDYLVIFFFLILITSSLKNINEIGSFIFLKSLLNLRFAILFIIIRNIINYKIINIYYIFIISLVCSTVLSFDIFLQHLVGFDIFGNPPFAGRYNGFFEHEAIAGSYLQKIFLFSLLSIFLSKIHKKAKFFSTIIFINILGAGILLSLDRMPYLIFVFSIVILFIILKKHRFKLFASFILVLFFFQIFYKNYNVVKERYERIMGQIDIPGISQIFLYNNKKILTPGKNINNDVLTDKITSDYLRIYIAAYNVFLEKPYIGSGLKSFLFECSKIRKFKEKNLRCSTHPHNIYLEILVSQGFIGISVFFIFIIILIIKSYVNFISSKINNKDKLIRILFFLILILELFPFRSYGSIFTTVNGSLFWFMLAITSPCYYLKKKIN